KAAASASRHNAQRMETSPHILVVDDSADIRDPLARYLVKNGMRVSKANGGQELRRTLKTNAIDLIVLDIMMPGEDGLSLCRFVRWTLDVPRQELIGADGVGVPLSTAEFRLLAVFVERPRMVLSREQLLDLTSGRALEPFERSIDNQVSRLRKKVETDPKNPS